MLSIPKVHATHPFSKNVLHSTKIGTQHKSRENPYSNKMKMTKLTLLELIQISVHDSQRHQIQPLIEHQVEI